jgi:hypothetical protein
MNRRVDEREWIQYQWDYLVVLQGGEARVRRLAYERCFSRRRKVESSADVLRLILTSAVAERSLGENGRFGDRNGIGRRERCSFVRAEQWLEAILGAICWLDAMFAARPR